MDPFWVHVRGVLDGAVGQLKCNFCGHSFAKDTSIARIKWHLSGEKGHGVEICGKVPKDIQEAAYQAMSGGNKRRKIDPGPSNGNTQIEEQGTEQLVEEGRTPSRAEAGSQRENLGGEMMHIGTSITAEGPIANAHDTRGEASQATDLVSRAIEKEWLEIMEENLMKDEEVENGTVAGTSSSGGRAHNTSESRGDALPTSSTKIVGGAFEENKKAILSWLNDDEVSRIGIYGMGGVGKTTLMRQIYEQIRGSCDVHWITVSQDFSIHGLQNRIANCIGLDLSKEEDKMQRVFKLLKALKRKLLEALKGKQRCVLIFDDLWDQFCPEEDVGIPVGENGFKLIVTTRSLQVCRQMDCERTINVHCLSEEEAWSLFIGILGHDMARYPEEEPIAKSVAMECDGLPLGIITLAGSMRGVHELNVWRNTLTRLIESNPRDMEDKVFRFLRFSYDRLDDLALKRCLLYCALFPEDHPIWREELIGYLIDEGIIKRKKNRLEEFDEGHTMLDRLENVCLLESATLLYDDGRYVKMHDLIRDMAIQIQKSSVCLLESCETHDSAVKMHELIRDMAIQTQQEDSSVMVKAGAQLEEMPDEQEWTENLVTVSLMENQIEEIPFDHSPRCPRLSTLLLCGNILQSIEKPFFEHLTWLKILDLSDTFIKELPESVSDLVHLVSLLLINCEKLRHVPSLEKLSALERLDLDGTQLDTLPQGMEGLSKLRYLRLNPCGGLPTEFPSGILSKLSHLQVFVAKLCFTGVYNRFYIPVNVKGKEVACLKKLETLKCSFESYNEFVDYLNLMDKTQSPRTYQIIVGQMPSGDPEGYCSYRISRFVLLSSLSINTDGDFQVAFPNDTEELMMLYCNDVRCLRDASLKDATELWSIVINDCNSMESLVSSSWFCSPSVLTLQSYNGIFSCLKRFSCYRCKSMKKLFPLVLLQNLKNLEGIYVSYCEKMEEIIGTGDEGGVMDEASSSNTSNAIIEVTLSKLRIFYLGGLPELESICSAKLICPSITDVKVINCEKLKRMPFSLPSQENGHPCPPPSLNEMNIYPQEWWERVVEWDHPNAKDVLRPFVKFSPY